MSLVVVKVVKVVASPTLMRYSCWWCFTKTKKKTQTRGRTKKCPLVTNSSPSFFLEAKSRIKNRFFYSRYHPLPTTTTNKEESASGFRKRWKNEAETFVHHRGSVSREGRKAHLVDELETTSVFGSLVLDLDWGHRQSRGGVQGDDGRGDEGDALCDFFFQFLSRKRRAFRLGKEKETNLR